jgi:hypothetical protein
MNSNTNTMDYSNTKKKKLIQLDNGRWKVEWKGGHKIFISEYHAQQYILKCEETRVVDSLNRGIYDNGIIQFNNLVGIGEDTIVKTGNTLNSYHIDYFEDE